MKDARHLEIASLVTFVALVLSCGVTPEDTSLGSDSDTSLHTSPQPDTESESKSTDDAGPGACLNDPLAASEVVYPEGIEGAACSASEPCPTGGLCSFLLFPQTAGYSSAKCYPACDSTASDAPCCAFGDRCVQLGAAQDSFACLAVGHARKQQLSVRLWPRGMNPNHTGIAVVSLDVVASGQKIPLNLAYAIEAGADINSDGAEEDVVILEFEGMAGTLGTWVLQITVPKTAWSQGERRADRLSDEADFDAVLTKWVGQTMTVVAVSTTGTLSIIEAGSACSAPPCDKATVSFDVELVSVSAVLSP
ncbi:MAG: hypothetical protein MUC50_18195 [Myxococcota bacterium]|jgi:hypothetical protein|nr:hypothetical protein [Myxococcota bacterium]